MKNFMLHKERYMISRVVRLSLSQQNRVGVVFLSANRGRVVSRKQGSKQGSVKTEVRVAFLSMSRERLL